MQKMGLHNRKYLKDNRKKLRGSLTPAEAALWNYLKDSQLEGRKFRRQHSVANYILDFYCPSERIAIELDGQTHHNTQAHQYDLERDQMMRELGIKVLRFENKDIFNKLLHVLSEIADNFSK